MGSEAFHTTASGTTPQEAFQTAVLEACMEHGLGGYTGTIAEKETFILIDLPQHVSPEEWAQHLIDIDDTRIRDKWGPAGCFQLENNQYYFFGWASS